MAKVGFFSTLQRMSSRYIQMYKSALNNPITFTPPGMFGHVVGWIWGEYFWSENSGSVSNRKQGLKLPSSYIIVGSLDEIWDDVK